MFAKHLGRSKMAQMFKATRTVKMKQESISAFESEASCTSAGEDLVWAGESST